MPREDWMWYPKGEDPIPIFEMETMHIVHVIAMVKRTGWKEECLPFLEEELRERGTGPDADLGDRFAMIVNDCLGAKVR
jgi:hypothetical protein